MDAIEAAPRRLLAPDILATTREYLARHVAPLAAQAAAGSGGVESARRLARAFDGLLSAYFCGAHTTWRAQGGGGRVALVAVGGYGRGLLAPGSDLDLVLLTDADDAAVLDPLAELLLYPLWDAGVSVGHAARTTSDLAELAAGDLRTATAVLDARVIAGDAAFAEDALAAARRRAVEGDPRGFIEALRAEMGARHGRFGGSVYLLEPEVKHGRGGIRDGDIARWCLAARWGAGDLDAALRAGALSEADHARLVAAQGFAWRLRGAMHRRPGRRSDRLTFDEQEESAARLGFVDVVARERDADGAVAAGAEALMSRWYLHAREVVAITDHLLDAALAHAAAPRVEAALRIDDALVVRDDALDLAAPEALTRDPGAALRLVEEAVARELPLAPAARAAVMATARDPVWCAALRAVPEAGATFLRLIAHSGAARLRAGGARPASSTPENPASVLAEMHDLGLLLAVVPEFEAVTARVQHDVYHVHTVDVHSVAAVDRLHAVARGEHAEAWPLPTELLARIDRRELLCLAALLHDVGKAHGRHHARAGAAMAGPIARRLGLGGDDADAVAWLVQEHLTLYHLATRRDLGDDATAARVAETFSDPWRLDALYLLTVVDLATTSPTAMTSWKARMLDELYLRARPGVSSRPGVEGDRVEALAAQAAHGAPIEDRDAVRAFARRMPARYLLATEPETVRRHARRVGEVALGETALCVDHLPGDASGTLLEVVVACPDRPGLLASLAALLHAQRLDVHHAEIHTREGMAFDVFAARAPGDRRPDLPRLEAVLRAQLAAMLAGEVDPAPRVGAAQGGGWSRAEPAVPGKVRVEQEASATATVVEVFGRDRPGFLYAIAGALHELGLAVHVAKVNTEGRRAADVFYVTEADGAKLSPARAEALRARLLREVA